MKRSLRSCLTKRNRNSSKRKHTTKRVRFSPFKQQCDLTAALEKVAGVHQPAEERSDGTGDDRDMKMRQAVQFGFTRRDESADNFSMMEPDREHESEPEQEGSSPTVKATTGNGKNRTRVGTPVSTKRRPFLRARKKEVHPKCNASSSVQVVVGSNESFGQILVGSNESFGDLMSRSGFGNSFESPKRAISSPKYSSSQSSSQLNSSFESPKLTRREAGFFGKVVPTLLSPPAKGNAWCMELEKKGNQQLNRSNRAQAATAEANPFHHLRVRGLENGVHRNGNRNDIHSNGNRNDSSNGSSDNNNALLFAFDCDPT